MITGLIDTLKTGRYLLIVGVVLAIMSNIGWTYYKKGQLKLEVVELNKQLEAQNYIIEQISNQSDMNKELCEEVQDLDTSANIELNSFTKELQNKVIIAQQRVKSVKDDPLPQSKRKELQKLAEEVSVVVNDTWDCIYSTMMGDNCEN